MLNMEQTCLYFRSCINSNYMLFAIYDVNMPVCEEKKINNNTKKIANFANEFKDFVMCSKHIRIFSFFFFHFEFIEDIKWKRICRRASVQKLHQVDTLLYATFFSGCVF